MAGEVDEREEFVGEHSAELTDALLSLGIEDADWHDGRGLADILFCAGWRKAPTIRARYLHPPHDTGWMRTSGGIRT